MDEYEKLEGDLKKCYEEYMVITPRIETLTITLPVDKVSLPGIS